jgi:hypothetical protein
MRLIPIVVLIGCNAGSGKLDPNLNSFNVGPVATILEPNADVTVAGGDVVNFVGLVDDASGIDALLVSWSSDIDGDIQSEADVESDGYTRFSTAALSEGPHVVTLSAEDFEGLIGTDQVLVEVQGDYGAPVLTIVTPEDGEEGVEDQSFVFAADVVDDRDSPEELDISLLSDAVNGEVCFLEHAEDDLFTCDAVLAPGPHNLTFRAEDTDGKVVTAERFFQVLLHSEVDDDGDGFSEVQGDCDDTDSDVYPGAKEKPNGVDDDCDGTIDEGTSAYDDDGDGQTEDDGDCDDNDVDVYLGNTELPDGKDNDCDGTIDEGTDLYDDDGDGYSEAMGDCDDNEAAKNPGTPEVCHDGLDNDCTGVEDDEDALGCDDWYKDVDGDGYGSDKNKCLCDPEPTINYDADETGDCDDGNSSVYPNATEIPYDSLDNDCKGGDLIDVDGDGYVAEFMGGGDCEDYVAEVNPGELEVADGQDQDCDGLKDEGTELYDDDGDGFCEAENSPCTLQSWQQQPWDNNDCTDADDDVYPGAPETCGDGIDSDCSNVDDDQIDAIGCVEYFYDGDGDAQGDPLVSECWCDPTGDFDVLTPNDTDCDDSDPNVYFGAAENPNGEDDDCDGTRDEGTDLYDDDGDGFCESLTDDCTIQDWMTDPDDYFATGDCDDDDEFSLPGGQEICHNGADDDCSNAEDDGLDNIDCTAFWKDGDYDDWPDTALQQCLCDADSVYDVPVLSAKDHDCDDAEASIHPQAAEVADGVDNNCDVDGARDEGTDLYDEDGDGFCGSDTLPCTIQDWMTDPSDYWDTGDCDDVVGSGEDINPDEVETCDTLGDDNCNNDDNDEQAINCSYFYKDADYDDQGDIDSQACFCVATAVYDIADVGDATDCDDGNPNVYEGADEIQNRADDNCDGNKDEGTDWYDDDGDGFCEHESQECTVQSWMTDPDEYWEQGDCDDDTSDDTVVDADDINPGADEICGDGVDNDCNDEDGGEGSLGCETYYRDQDEDDYGNGDYEKCLCEATKYYDIAPVDLGVDGEDCDDNNSTVHPGGSEATGASNVDDNCNGTKDEGTDLHDDDGDGYCESTTTQCTKQTSVPRPLQGDCDDVKGSGDNVNPGEDEVCNNGKDDNCADGQDESQSSDPGWSGYSEYWKDNDNDGQGHETDSLWLCDANDVNKYNETNNTDCDDGRNDVYLGAPELPDGIDNDCDSDGLKDEGTELHDDDGDGYCESTTVQCTKQAKVSRPSGGDCSDNDSGVYPGRSEVCNNGKDDNCADGQDEAKSSYPGWSNYERYYRDADADGYGRPSDYYYLCDANDVATYNEFDNDDCDDTDWWARPNQTSYLTVGNNNLTDLFDYNCDGSIKKKYDSAAYNREAECAVSVDWVCSNSWCGCLCPDSVSSCRVSKSGWLPGSGEDSPECGDTREFMTTGESSTGDCDWTGIPICTPGSSAPKQQACR